MGKLVVCGEMYELNNLKAELRIITVFIVAYKPPTAEYEWFD